MRPLLHCCGGLCCLLFFMLEWREAPLATRDGLLLWGNAAGTWECKVHTLHSLWVVCRCVHPILYVCIGLVGRGVCVWAWEWELVIVAVFACFSVDLGLGLHPYLHHLGSKNKCGSHFLITLPVDCRYLCPPVQGVCVLGDCLADLCEGWWAFGTQIRFCLQKLKTFYLIQTEIRLCPLLSFSSYIILSTIWIFI